MGKAKLLPKKSKQKPSTPRHARKLRVEDKRRTQQKSIQESHIAEQEQKREKSELASKIFS